LFINNPINPGKEIEKTPSSREPNLQNRAGLILLYLRLDWYGSEFINRGVNN